MAPERIGLVLILAAVLVTALIVTNSLDERQMEVRMNSTGSTQVHISNNFRDDQRVLHLTGEAVNFGSSGEYELYVDAEGRFVQRIEGVFRDVIGFDGVHGWTSDPSRLTRRLSRAELAWNQLNFALQSGNWPLIEGLFVLAENDEEGIEGQRVYNAKHRDSGLDAQFAIDRRSGRPLWMSRHGMVGLERVDYSAFVDRNGISVPRQIRYTADGYETRLVSIDRQSGMANGPRGVFEAEEGLPDDFLFDGSVSPELEVKKTRAGHFLIRPVINGHQMGWFFLDTGASSSAIDVKAAKKLELVKIGEVPLTSIFGRELSPLYGAQNVIIGPITIEQPHFVEMDLAQVNEALGVEIEGVIGYPLFARAIVEVDVSSDRVFVHDSKNFNLDEGEWEELILDFNHPVIEASYEGEHIGQFRLDIGAGNNNVLFHSEAVEELNLLSGREIIDEQDFGHGPIVFGELDWIEIAGVRFEGVQAAFSKAESGPFADTNTTGNIGVGLLSSFRLIFDYQNARISFVEAQHSSTRSP